MIIDNMMDANRYIPQIFHPLLARKATIIKPTQSIKEL